MVGIVDDVLPSVVATQAMSVTRVTLIGQGVEEFAEDDGSLVGYLVGEERIDVGCHCNSRMAC